MEIREIFDVEVIAPLHNLVFGQDFPYKSYHKKKTLYPVYMYAYFDNDIIIGYSIIIDEHEKKNLYAWYGGVLPKYQGNGITIKFFDVMVNRARSMNYNSVTLATTNFRPHMIRLAIKYGFDIYDLKKRDYGEGNKIYFVYKILPKSAISIDIYPNNHKIKEVELEKILVRSYKSNCKEIVITNIKTVEDVDIVGYCIRYCNSFVHKPSITVNTTFEIINLMVSNYNN